MPITLSICDVDDELMKMHSPIIVNDLATDTDVDRAHLERITTTRYNKSDMLSTIPTCTCGKTRLGINVGVICDKCGTEVLMNASSVKSELWLRAPNTMATLILPVFALMLYNNLSVKRNYNGLAYILNPTQLPPKGTSPNIRLFMRLFSTMPRGIDGLRNNLDEYIERIYQYRKYKIDDLREFVIEYRAKLFPKYIPIPSRLTMVIEDTHVGTYYDKSMDKVLDAVYTVAGTGNIKNATKVASRIGTAIINLVEYYKHLLAATISGKKGLVRKSVLGGRLNNAWRDIITSRHGPHKYDELVIPRHLAITMAKPIIMGKLVRDHEMSILQAYDYIETNIKKKDKLLTEILYQLVEETKPMMMELTGNPESYGFVVNFIRYPSLRIGSSQTFYVKEFSDDSTEISVLVLKANNADFDGDELQGMMLFGRELIEQYLKLAPHYDIHSSRIPGTFSNSIGLPDTCTLNVHKFLESEKWAPEMLERMEGN